MPVFHIIRREEKGKKNDQTDIFYILRIISGQGERRNFAKRNIFYQAIVMKRPFICLMLPAALLLAGCSKKAGEPTLRTVELTLPQPLYADGNRSFAGRVEENKEVAAAFKTPGQIARLAVRKGDRVREGQLLAVLDDKDYRLGVEASEIQYKQLQAEVERLRLLYEGRSLSANDYEKAVAGLSRAGVQLQADRNKLEYTQLKSPASGYVSAVNFETGEMVDAGTAVCTILNTDGLAVTVALPAAMCLDREQIASCVCTSNLLPGKKMPMRLNSLVPKADADQLYTARYVFEGQPDGHITAGMNVELTFGNAPLAQQAARCFRLPLHALLSKGGRTAVWVMRADSTVQLVPVKTDGIDAEGNAVITGGLSGGEQVVKAGVHALRQGEKVRPLAPESPTNIGGLL